MMFENLLKAVIGTVLLPVTVAADAAWDALLAKFIEMCDAPDGE